jgi:hypothetical protein
VVEMNIEVRVGQETKNLEVVTQQPMGGINMLVVKGVEEVAHVAQLKKDTRIMLSTDEIMGICKGKEGNHDPYTLIIRGTEAMYIEGEVKPSQIDETEPYLGYTLEGLPFGLPEVYCPDCNSKNPL